MLLVDAANVIGSRPDGWWRDRGEAARKLVEWLRAAVASGSVERPVIVIVEGKARSGVREDDSDGVSVRHANGSGDDLIVELAAAAVPATPVVVVSADRELLRRVSSIGATTIGPGWLRGRLSPDSGRE